MPSFIDAEWPAEQLQVALEDFSSGQKQKSKPSISTFELGSNAGHVAYSFLILGQSKQRPLSTWNCGSKSGYNRTVLDAEVIISRFGKHILSSLFRPSIPHRLESDHDPFELRQLC